MKHGLDFSECAAMRTRSDMYTTLTRTGLLLLLGFFLLKRVGSLFIVQALQSALSSKRQISKIQR